MQKGNLLVLEFKEQFDNNLTIITHELASSADF